MTNEKTIESDDYHDYVIKDGKLVGRFEEMYRNCDNPWPETEEELEFLPTSSRTPQIINHYGYKQIFSVGSGKGMHLNWLRKKCPHIKVEGCEISKTAANICRRNYPEITVHVMDVAEFPSHDFDFDLILIRETVWYILKHWQEFCDHIREKYRGCHIIIELSFYDTQTYGNDYFDGPDEFVAKFPFEIKEIVRYHVTKKQREGMISVYGKI
ncbi:MAG: class I SAM-dependent methyltransferase [Deltaproteobacteria bacterium]|nr:class I SAM-dependent methyltransferase [Deltaproteobacteria bacterium]